MKKSRFMLTVMAALALAMVMSGCALLSGILGGKKTDPTIPDNDISYDSGALRNVRRVSDDGLGKGWITVSKDGQSLLYLESSEEINYDKRAKRVDTTITNRVIYLRNASVFAKTPTSVSAEVSATYDLTTKASYYVPPGVSAANPDGAIFIGKGATAQDGVNARNSLIAKMTAATPSSGSFYEDGANFIYSDAERGNRRLVKASVGNTAKTFITQNPIGSGDSYPSVRNGVIVCQTSGNIVTLREDGSGVVTLGPGGQPSWHPTENRVVFVHEGNVMEMNITTKQQTQIYGVSGREKQEGASCILPFYTEDGKHILFLKRAKVASYKQGKTDIPIFRWHLYGMNTDGSGVTVFTSGNLDILHYGVGRDNKVFFISNAGNVTEIWSADIEF